MEHVLMDERGNTTKTYGKNRSVLAYVLFALMFIVGGVGIALFYNSVHGASGSQALPAATFTPFLSSPLGGFGGKCEIIPDAEDFITCKNDYENVAEAQVLRCPSGYDNIRVTKVRLGETGQKSPRDMSLMRHACLGMDSCKVTLADLRVADDGTALAPAAIPVEEEEIIIEPEDIIEEVAGVDSNGHVLMKHHEHYHHYPGKVKVYYECDKIEENPFSFLESIFEDMIGEPEVSPEEEVVTEETATEETPIFLSKALGHKCKTKLKNVAQDWDAGHVCGTSSQEMTLSCDPDRNGTGTRIFVLNVTPKIQKRPAAPAAGADSGVDPVIEDTTSSVANEPFLAKHGGHHKNGAKGNKKQGKHLGWQLTDICATQTGDCTTTLGTDLQLQAANPLIDDTTPIHVKYLCSYEH